MNFGNSIGGITLMVLAVVWLAVFVPQWARRAQEPISGHRSRSRKDAERAHANLSASELQMLRLTRTRQQMATVAVLSIFGWIGTFTLTAGTPLGFLSWVIAAVAVTSLLLSLAASRRLIVVAGNSSSNRSNRLSSSSKAPAINLKATPLPRRGWTPNPIPEPVHERPVGEMVMRGAKVVPLIDPAASSEATTNATPEIQSVEIDEILRRRRAN